MGRYMNVDSDLTNATIVLIIALRVYFLEKNRESMFYLAKRLYVQYQIIV